MPPRRRGRRVARCHALPLGLLAGLGGSGGADVLGRDTGRTRWGAVRCHHAAGLTARGGGTCPHALCVSPEGGGGWHPWAGPGGGDSVPGTGAPPPPPTLSKVETGGCGSAPAPCPSRGAPSPLLGQLPIAGGWRCPPTSPQAVFPQRF